MVTFQKDRHALDSFEERYLSALRVRMELTLFLHAEINSVEELIQTEEKRRQDEAEREQQKTQVQIERKSIADRVFEENLQKIQKYPRMEIHQEAVEDIERLFGALGGIERELWRDLETLIRKTYTSATVSPRARLAEQLLKLCSPTSMSIPPRLSRYQSLFDWFPRKYTEIEKEEKKCILEAAFFLHDLAGTLKEISSSEGLSPQDKQKVETMIEYVHTVINDFRLKDFKQLHR